MGIRENKQVFQAAMAAVPSVPKATMKGADMNARYLTFETPLTFIPHEQGVTVEVSCATKGMPNLMQNGRNRKIIKQFIDALSSIVQVNGVEVIAS